MDGNKIIEHTISSSKSGAYLDLHVPFELPLNIKDLKLALTFDNSNGIGITSEINCVDFKLTRY